MRRRLFVGLVIAGVVTACVTAMFRWRSGSDRVAAPPHGWQIGKRYEYAIRIDSRVRGGAAVNIDLTLDGMLEVRALSSALVRWQWTGDVTGKLGERALDEQALARGLRAPVWLELARDGNVTGVRLETDGAPWAATTWTALAEAMELAPPPQPGATTWHGLHDDSMGRYEATYTATADGSVHKRRTRYVQSAAAGLAFDVERSQIDVGLRPQPAPAASLLASFACDERVRSHENGPVPSFTGEYRYELRLMRESRDAEVESLLAGADRLPRFAPDSLSSQIEAAQLDDARTAGLTARDAMARLLVASRKQTLTAEEERALGRAYVALTTWMRTSPAALELAREHLEAHGPLTLDLIGALRDAGTPAAQATLRALLDKRGYTPEQRLEVARALGRVEAPDAESVAALASLVTDPVLGRQARYGLGSAAYRLRDKNPALAAQARDTLVARLDGATSDDERVMLLVALGNAGDPVTLTKVLPALTSGSPAVRTAAAQALRRMPADGPIDAALARASTDPESKVRSSAMNAISERAPSDALVAAVIAASVSDGTFEVRLEAVRCAKSWLAARPELRPTLERIATGDPNADLRRIALEALAGRASGG